MNQSIKNIFEEFNKQRKSIEITIDEVKSNLDIFINRIILYGAGSAGIALLKYLNDIEIYPVYFSDGDESKWGKTCEGIKIIPPSEITRLVGKEALVIITINTDGKKFCKSFKENLKTAGHTGVHKMLKEIGCTNIIDYPYFRRCYALFKGDKYNLPSCSDVSCMSNNIDRIEKAYSLLTDELSKDIFIKILKFRLLDDSIKIPTLDQANQYFEYNIYKKIDNECFIDCGAFNGITLKNFLLHNEFFSNYCAFEPDINNYLELKHYVDSLKSNNIYIYNLALYNQNCQKLLYNLKGPGSFISNIGRDLIDCSTIDSILKDRKVTFIKMNVEGAEIQALEGAKKVINLNEPTLAIAGYHKTWDLWEVPNLISNINKDYNIYLRSYMNHISFVYYIVPKSRIILNN